VTPNAGNLRHVSILLRPLDCALRLERGKCVIGMILYNVVVDWIALSETGAGSVV
jgi:hypothetical protein